MISIIDSIKLVLKTMIEKKGRVFLTISGIIIGIFTFTFFIFLSQGLTNAISEQFSSFGVNVLGINPANAGGGGPPTGEGLTDTDVAKVKQVAKDFKYVAPFIFYQGFYEFSREGAVIVTVSYEDSFWEDVGEDLGIEIEKGRNIKAGDSGVVVIGAKTAQNAFSRELDVGYSVEVEGRSFRIVGIIKERGDLFIDNSMLMPFDDVQEISGQDTYSGIRASFLEGADLEANREAILRRLNPNGEEERVRITSPEQVIEQVGNILGVLTLIISFVSSVALLVGGINVMNTMYSNVIERINEISVMKAMGATNRDVLVLFLMESSMLGFIGALIGFFMSYGVAEALSYFITNYLGYNVPVYFDFLFFIQVMIVTIFFAVLFGTYPATRAAYVDPADNLRDE